MKKLACTILCSLTAIPVFAAADAPDEQATATPRPQSTLELKRKSSFVVEEAGRNPFWPIGWKPAPKQTGGAPTEHASPDIPASVFLVSSITVDATGKYAIINGKPMSEGQVFGLQMGSQTYQITVKAIQDGQVILLRRDREIAVPLRRR